MMAQVPFIDLKAQYAAYKEEFDEAIARVVQSGGFVLGPEVAALEAELAAYVGSRHCIGCASGTDALYIALRALGIGPGDEVITTGFSFFATAGAVSLVGATPVFADIDPDTYNLDPSCLPKLITRNTKAIIPVGLYGQCADMDAISEIAGKNGIAVVEDAAQSFGATYKGRKSCTLATIGCTSFYPAKPLGSFGEGGALFTDDEKLSTAMRRIANQGQRAGYDHSTVGINGRLQAVQAAVLRVKLAHFDAELAVRQKVAARYRSGLSGIAGVTLPTVRDMQTSVYAQYTVGVARRDALREHLSSVAIPTAVHYPKPIYRQDAYAHFGAAWLERSIKACPNIEAATARVVSLPFGPFLKEEDQDRVIAGVRAFMERVA
jgi:UDP-2-acetamido-2-deoxy-ribo-hexuluronate aminotransferase